MHEEAYDEPGAMVGNEEEFSGAESWQTDAPEVPFIYIYMSSPFPRLSVLQCLCVCSGMLG